MICIVMEGTTRLRKAKIEVTLAHWSWKHLQEIQISSFGMKIFFMSRWEIQRWSNTRRKHKARLDFKLGSLTFFRNLEFKEFKLYIVSLDVQLNPNRLFGIYVT